MNVLKSCKERKKNCGWACSAIRGFEQAATSHAALFSIESEPRGASLRIFAVVARSIVTRWAASDEADMSPSGHALHHSQNCDGGAVEATTRDEWNQVADAS